ncbi:MAG TPA: MerR family transcriptional regulator [Gammaproteobacteria bacterium]
MYNISAVSSLTGVNPITLRAWERRYGLIKPTRTPKGHRLYSENDISTINQVVKLLEQGIAASQVGHYLNQQGITPTETGNPWQVYQERMHQAVINFDEPALEKIYNEAMALYPVSLVTRELLVPLLRALGDRWQSQQRGVGEEHFFAVFMRNKLGSRFHHRNLNNRGPKILAACLPGEHHELGLLLFSLAAHERDYRIILLGANMPIDELPDIAIHTRCVAIVLSVSTSENLQQLAHEITMLVGEVRIPVFIGGNVTRNNSSLIQKTGAIAAGDDIGESLHTINQYLQQHKPAGDAK